MLFRVVKGNHVEAGPPDCDCERCKQDREAVKADPPKPTIGHVYRAGDIVDSSSDLGALFNQQDAIKFERVNASGQVIRQVVMPKRNRPPSPSPQLTTSGSDGLDDMTVADLRKHAEEEEIDLGSATRKEDILKEIRKALVGSAAESGFGG